ncbi:hypothetical protein [Acinetobacter baumannii]|uniref:Uncharacterized protein n=2 Tax=Acinetobacter baumannii TaxID=470 RepID=A0A241ZI41_ACIBA|nr:hypothetical protein [Acinetobacter baumannii]ENW74844.1 hypothetical protein F913_00894 [Acinetobacter baumannii NIPH 80]MBF6767292.1 hypothetical protein [Acinetobacter baumannii]MCB5209600.1 hypothetical protein [Acinetobacter baumannii]MDU9017680.1 hypothetical protein [Acinetobacter baumannii]MDV4341370.1 hypothetical protein [Acinetobacter baumannii]
MNKLLRIIFLFTFSLSITHAQVYYEDITKYSLQDIPESYLDKINNFDGKDGLKSNNMPSYYNKHGEFCLINYNESFWKHKKKGDYIFTSFSTRQQCKKNNIINQTEIKGVCPIYEEKIRREYTVKDSKRQLTNTSVDEMKPIYLGFFKRDDSVESMPIVQEEKEPISFENLTALDLTLLCSEIRLEVARKRYNQAKKEHYDSTLDKILEKANKDD